MPEPFKNFFNHALIDHMADRLAAAWPSFDTSAFQSLAGADLESLELKQRSAQITQAMVACLPEDFPTTAGVLLAALGPTPAAPLALDEPDGLSGWAIMPLSDYVGLHGCDHFDLSMDLLKQMTKRFTAEFAVRYFLIEDAPRTIEKLASWLDDPSEHVRRLISEGTRPRLPWAMSLPMFIADPSPVLPLLEALKDDPHEYVRRSVANNLNDIAKDHPDVVARIAQDWLVGASESRRRLVRHACRSLIKQGHSDVLAAFGYSAPSMSVERFEIKTPRVQFGDALEFDLVLSSTLKAPQPLIIDYAVHHQKANGSTSPKVFKWKTTTLMPGVDLAASRRHPMRPVTTRTYYPGRHSLEILVNGSSVASAEFELEI